MESKSKKSEQPDCFLFYRSFFDAIKCLQPDLQLELYNTIANYALFGIEPENISDVSLGMFTLIRPILDANASKREGGKKGGRPRKDNTPAYALTFVEEVDKLINDNEWRAAVCEEYTIEQTTLTKRLQAFLHFCQETRADRPHTSLDDAKTHFRYWLDKSNSKKHTAPPAELPAQDINYDFNGGFGSIDN